MSSELVSIIIPVYNKESYLSNCIESIMNQRYKNIEIIIIDDGSDDDSLQICEKYKQLDNRVQVYSQKNSGVSHARNKGLLLARGDYISFVDADDYIKEDFVTILINAMMNHRVDVVFCNLLQDYEGKIIEKKPKLVPGKHNAVDLFPILIDDGTITGILLSSVCTGLYKKNIVFDNNIKFEESLTHNEDGIFNLEVLLNSQDIYYLGDKYLYVNKRVSDSATKGIVDDNRFEDATEKIIEVYQRYGINIENDVQLKRRKLSIAFWKIISFSNAESKDSISIISSILSDKELKDTYKYLDYKKINKPKMILSFLMKQKQAKLLYYLINKVYPLLSPIYKR